MHCLYFRRLIRYALSLFSAIDFAKKIFLGCRFQLCSFVSPIFVLGQVHRLVIPIRCLEACLMSSLCHSGCVSLFTLFVLIGHVCRINSKCLGKEFKVLICIYLRNVEICNSCCHV